MKRYVVSALDVAAGVYGAPVCFASTGLAVRSFTDEVNRKGDDNPMYNHPGDFQLFALATFDDVSGKFDCSDCPLRLALATDVKL